MCCGGAGKGGGAVLAVAAALASGVLSGGQGRCPAPDTGAETGTPLELLLVASCLEGSL